MTGWYKINLKDFYNNAVGDDEYTYVTQEVYEILVNTFRKEAHAQEMQDLRHIVIGGYIEGETEELLKNSGEDVEDIVIKKMDMEILQKAMQSLTEIQRERLYLYFFSGLTFRQIGERLGVSDKSVRESIEASLKKIRKFFDYYPLKL